MSVLHESAASGDTERLGDLLDQKKYDKDEPDNDWGGRTPLMWAVIAGHVRSVKLLLQVMTSSIASHAIDFVRKVEISRFSAEWGESNHAERGGKNSGALCCRKWEE